MVHFKFDGKRCADEYLIVDNEEDRMHSNLVMLPCFLNLFGDEESQRSASRHYTGNLTVFDVFNNVFLKL